MQLFLKHQLSNVEESPGPNSLLFHLINAQIASKAGEEEGGEEEEGGGGDVNPVGLWRQNISLQGQLAASIREF